MHLDSLDKIKVSNIPLDKVFTISKSDKLAQLIYLMSKKGADRAIVTSEGIPVGVATIKDVFIKLSTRRLIGLSPSSMSVSGFMSDKFVSGKLDEDLLTVSRRMRDEDISALPIISDRQPIGLVTRKMIVGLLKNKGQIKVKDIVTPSIITINSDAKLPQALEKIRKSPIREIVVVVDDKPVGIISEKEIALTLFDLLSRDSIHHADSAFKKLLVMDVMKRADEYVEPDSYIEKAIDILLNKELNTLPVMADNEFIGLLTRDVIFLKFLELEEREGWKKL
ncbi:MAG: CBS domain-containing protein [archaeon]|nr:CBS domain-containing protein [archaeon]MCP8312883.1 CBS domain-containing protein [archaeon]